MSKLSFTNNFQKLCFHFPLLIIRHFYISQRRSSFQRRNKLFPSRHLYHRLWNSKVVFVSRKFTTLLRDLDEQKRKDSSRERIIIGSPSLKKLGFEFELTILVSANLSGKFGESCSSTCSPIREFLYNNGTPQLVNFTH